MTVPTTFVPLRYSGSGTTGPFPVPYQFGSDTYLRVRKTVGTSTTTLTLTADYTVTGAGLPSGGNVTLTAPLAIGEVLEIDLGGALLTQAADYVNGGKVDFEDLEDSFDARALADQWLQQQINRSIRAPDGSLPELPNVNARKGLYLRFNAGTGAPEAALLDVGALSGSALTAYPIVGDGSAVDFVLGEMPSSKNHVLITLSGTLQERSTYSLSGSTITFSEAPPEGVTGEILVIRALSLASAGDASAVAYQPSGTNAVERTVQAALRTYMPTLEDFGGGTSVADNAAAFQAAMNAGGRLYIPAGNRYLIKSAITRTGFLNLVGGGSLVWTSDATSTGLTVSLTTADGSSGGCEIGAVQFRTQKSGEGTALTVDATAQISGSVLGNRTHRRVSLQDTVFRGDNAPGVDGWLNHVDLQGVSNFEADGVYISGHLDPDETGIQSETGILADDQGSAAVLNLSRVSIYYCQDAVSYDGGEGVNISQCNFVAVDRGVLAVNSNTGYAPQLTITASHINARLRAIDATEIQGISVIGNYLWQRRSATAPGAAVYLVDVDDVNIRGNQFTGDYVNTSGVIYYGVLINTVTDAVVEGNHGQDVTFLAWTQTGCDDVVLRNNHVSKEAVLAPVPGLYANTSSGRVIIDAERLSGKSASDVTAASGTLVDVDMGTVHLGQKFIVTAKVLYTKGATAGLTSTEVLKGAGTATVVFVHDATTLDFEVEQDATDANTHTVTGPMIVTATGTLTLRCQFTSAGSDATILTGNAQLSAFQLGSSGRLG